MSVCVTLPCYAYYYIIAKLPYFGKGLVAIAAIPQAIANRRSRIVLSSLSFSLIKTSTLIVVRRQKKTHEVRKIWWAISIILFSLLLKQLTSPSFF